VPSEQGFPYILGQTKWRRSKIAIKDTPQSLIKHTYKTLAFIGVAMVIGFIGVIISILISNNSYPESPAEKGVRIYNTNIPLACPHWKAAQSALTSGDYTLALESLEESEPYEIELFEVDPWFETIYNRHSELKEKLPEIITGAENSNIPLGLEITIQSLKYDIAELCSSQ
jgi:glutaredoxin